MIRVLVHFSDGDATNIIRLAIEKNGLGKNLNLGRRGNNKESLDALRNEELIIQHNKSN